jgi:endonuclease-3
MSEGIVPRESSADKQARARKIIRLLRQRYPEAKCSLDFGSVHQLMVATILSAQCTDERVNLVTPDLFKRFRTVQEFAEADPAELEKLVYTTGFYVNKAKAIKTSARQLIERHRGEVPRTLGELTKLTGVGRKTGSVILGVGYGIAEGVVVDTHVGRISRLLGFTAKADPVKVEQGLMKVIPREDWIDYSHLLIFHGRAICKARTPDCPACPLKKLCPSVKV